MCRHTPKTLTSSRISCSFLSVILGDGYVGAVWILSSALWYFFVSQAGVWGMGCDVWRLGVTGVGGFLVDHDVACQLWDLLHAWALRVHPFGLSMTSSLRFEGWHMLSMQARLL